jgi:hypothetical protein
VAKSPVGLWRQPRHSRSRDLNLALATVLARNSAVAIPPTVARQERIHWDRQ